MKHRRLKNIAGWQIVSWEARGKNPTADAVQECVKAMSQWLSDFGQYVQAHEVHTNNGAALEVRILRQEGGL